MSSTETSGAPAEATATPQPGTPAAAPSFGTSRGSGLARGKRTSTTAPTASPAAGSAEYTPTAIEIVNAPREYKNPFAPAASETSEPAAVAVINEPAPTLPVVTPVAAAPAPAPYVAPVTEAHFPASFAEPAEQAEKVELNILPPERPKTVAPQTWESEGFQGNRERDPRPERPRREFRRDNERREEVPVPSKFRYERAKDGPLPPRPAPSSIAASTPVRASTPVAAPAKSGGFFGWLKSLFSSTPAAAPAETRSTEPRPEGRDGQRHRRHRGGRGRGNFHGQGNSGPVGENRSHHDGQSEHGEGGHRRRRRRHGRGHGEGHGHEHRDQAGGHSGPSAT